MNRFHILITSLLLPILFSIRLSGQDIRLEGTVVIPTIESENEAGDLLVRTNDGTVKQKSLSSLPQADCDNPWVLAGVLKDLVPITSPPMAGITDLYPVLEYEYGVNYTAISPQIIPIVISYWTAGWRVYSRYQFLVNSDDPTKDTRYGGLLFYRGTNASDDDACTEGTWRHKYWYIDSSTNEVVTFASNGCASPPVYVRKR